MDRLLQQALLQVLTPIFEPLFSGSSWGFRPGRSAHDAVRAARGYVREGRDWVVDMDIAKFFDHVNHDILIRRIAPVIRDKRILRLIGRYLRAGLLVGGKAGSERGGHAARRAFVAAAGEHLPRRARPGTGEARAPLLPLRRRLCATSAERAARASKCATAQLMRVGPLGTGLQEQVPNHLRRLWSKAMVVSTEGKGLERTRSGDWQEEDRKGTTDDVSKA